MPMRMIKTQLWCMTCGLIIATVSLALVLLLTQRDTTEDLILKQRNADTFKLAISESLEELTVKNNSTERSENSSITTTSNSTYVKKVVTNLTYSPTMWWKNPQRPCNSKDDIIHWNEPGESWGGGFCKEFIGGPFDKTSVVCNPLSNRITCYGSKYNKKIGTCTITQIAVKPSKLYDAIRNQKVMHSQSSWLVQQQQHLTNHPCSKPNFNDIETYMEPGDYIRPFVKMSALEVPKGQCNVWLKGTTFFYMGMENHIYFRFLGWYNLHRTLLAHYNDLQNFTIVRIPEGNNTFLFPEYEQKLFPGVVRLQDFDENIVCFEKLVLVPWAYAATPFRCKMDGAALRQKCSTCDGHGIENDLKSFRRRVVSACSLTDNDSVKKNKKTKVIVIKRKQYNRRIGDVPKVFPRVWQNSDEVVERIQSEFPNANVTGIYAEDLSLCDQVALAHDTDVLIGMHGAGLVHLWWLQKHAVIVELIPRSQRGNAAFITLAKLLGIKHKGFTQVLEKKTIVNVNVNLLLKDLSSLI